MIDLEARGIRLGRINKVQPFSKACIAAHSNSFQLIISFGANSLLIFKQASIIIISTSCSLHLMFSVNITEYSQILGSMCNVHIFFDTGILEGLRATV